MPEGHGVKLFGDWGKVTEILGELPEKFKAASKIAAKQEAHFLRGEMVKYLRESDHFTPLSKKTLAMRAFQGFGGSKPLIRRGDLRNNISIHEHGEAIFIGIVKNAKNKKGQPLISIAQLMEEGSGPIVVPVTAKSSKMYHMAMAKAGIAMPKHGGSRPAVVVIRIPPRPFIEPVFKKYCTPSQVRARFYDRLRKMLGDKLGG